MIFFIIFFIFCLNGSSFSEELEDKKKPLRVASLKSLNPSLPRGQAFYKQSLNILTDFAHDNGYQINYHYVDTLKACFQLLKARKVDIIAAHITEGSPYLDQDMVLSSPLYSTYNVLISKKNVKFSLANDIQNKTIGYFDNSHYRKTAEELKKKFPSVHIAAIPPQTTIESVYDNLLSNQFDFFIFDHNKILLDRLYRKDIFINYQISDSTDVRWALSSHTSSLVSSFNKYIQSSINNTALYTQQEQNSIKIGVLNDSYSYYHQRGQLLGYHYELVKDFMDSHNLLYYFIVAHSRAELINLLHKKKIDIAASFFPHDQVLHDTLVALAPILKVERRIVTRKNQSKLTHYTELKNRYISIPENDKSQAFFKELIKNNELKILTVPAYVSDIQLIQGVGQGVYDATIALSHLIDMETQFLPNLESSLSFEQNIPLSWLSTKAKATLTKQLNQYITANYRSEFFNVLYKRYFKNKSRHLKVRKLLINKNQISRFDSIIKKHAGEFDWILLVAQMYQESQFNPKAQSPSGAIGLFQIMARTALHMGYKDFTSAEDNIKVAITYMHWLKKQIKKMDIHPEEEIWFILAAYNSGLGHIQDAIKLTKALKGDTSRWFGHVEKSLLLLEKPTYYKKARYGYAQARQTIHYVNNIQHFYLSYLAFLNLPTSQ